MSTQKSFTDFLKHTLSRKEISLAIAKDDVEFQELIKNLEENGFRQAIDASDLFKHITNPSSKIFFAAKESLPKDMYDFIIQYPTGQIEIYDQFNLKSKLVIPVYDRVSVVFLITKEALKKSQELGLQILGQVGIAYQS
jgi:hypothetical protein